MALKELRNLETKDPVAGSVGGPLRKANFTPWSGATDVQAMARMSCSLIFTAEYFPLPTFGNICNLKPGIIST